MRELKWRRGTAEVKGADGPDQGSVTAVVSTFDDVDTDGDVVRASAFTDGQPVPMVWSHNWQEPVGKGVIEVQEDRAVFKGGFFMDTDAGVQAFKSVRAMGDLQEWSWGFRILEAEFGDLGEGDDAVKVQFINRTEVFEVSPVLVGANRDTATLGIKAQPGFEVGELAHLWGMITIELKEGRRLSEATMGRVTSAVGAMKSAVSALEKLLANEAEAAAANDNDLSGGKHPDDDEADKLIDEALAGFMQPQGGTE